jgi:hypothetical protein
MTPMYPYIRKDVILSTRVRNSRVSLVSHSSLQKINMKIFPPEATPSQLQNPYGVNIFLFYKFIPLLMTKVKAETLNDKSSYVNNIKHHYI